MRPSVHESVPLPGAREVGVRQGSTLHDVSPQSFDPRPCGGQPGGGKSDIRTPPLMRWKCTHQQRVTAEEYRTHGISAAIPIQNAESSQDPAPPLVINPGSLACISE